MPVTILNLQISRRLLCLAALIVCAATARAQVRFRLLNPEQIESRLKNFSTKNAEREATLKSLFLKSGCAAENISEQSVKNNLPPNLICVLPGKTDQIIVVGAHTDHVEAGDGVVDNWSGAALLPSLFYSLSAEPREHTYVFVGFTAEEKEMMGSAFYVSKLSKEQRAKIDGMVNFDTLGLGPTEVWSSHADKQLLDALAIFAYAAKLPITGMNVDGVGSTDSESFAKHKIPRITLHSLTSETLPILHSDKDKLTAIRLDDYYATYRLSAGYLAFLDSRLGQSNQPPAKSGD